MLRSNNPVITAPVVRRLAAAGVITAGWAACVGVSPHVGPSALVHDCALFVHLVSLVAGMGAVLTVDWFAARWLLGRHQRSEVIRLVGGAHSLIWLGFVGLTISGALLQPDVDSTVTRVKLVAVLVLALNGLHAHALQSRLATAATVDGVLMLRAGAVATVSQLGWWTALVIGFSNGH